MGQSRKRLERLIRWIGLVSGNQLSGVSYLFFVWWDDADGRFVAVEK